MLLQRFTPSNNWNVFLEPSESIDECSKFVNAVRNIVDCGGLYVVKRCSDMFCGLGNFMFVLASKSSCQRPRGRSLPNRLEGLKHSCDPRPYIHIKCFTCISHCVEYVYNRSPVYLII